METRRLTLSDLDACFACRMRGLEKAPSAFLTTLAEELAHGPQRWAKLLEQTGDDDALFGAVADGDVRGMVGVRRDGHVKTRHKAIIWGMYVDPEWQGQGIGGRLLDLAVQHARERMRAAAICLSVGKENEAARRLYASRGFVVWGDEPLSLWEGGRFHDELHMILTLTPRP